MNPRPAVAGVVIGVSLFLLAGCCGPCLVPCIPGVWPRPDPPMEISDDPAKLLAPLTNESLRWRRTARGPEPYFLDPFNRDRIVPKLDHAGGETTNILIAMLDDPKRFAVAHVLLTRGAGGPVMQTDTSWNGMTVEIGANGNGIVHPEERTKLQALWSASKGSSSR